MKSIILFSIIAALLLLSVPARAQTGDTNLDQFAHATNILFIPYIGYDIQKHEVGYGGVVLRKVSDYFYAGIRFEDFNHTQTTAGVQGQLQVSGTFAGISYTPFIETSIGIGKDSLYGNTGAGVVITFHEWVMANKDTISLRAIADFEHYVNGNQNGERANAGLCFDWGY